MEILTLKVPPTRGDSIIARISLRAANGLAARGLLAKRFSDQHNMTLPSTNLLCDALHRASPDPEGPSHLQDTHAFRKLVSHLPFGRIIYLRPAEFHALRYRALETCFDPLADHRPLKLSKGTS